MTERTAGYGKELNHTELLGVSILTELLRKKLAAHNVVLTYVRGLTHGTTTAHWGHSSEPVIALYAGYRCLATGKMGKVDAGIVLSRQETRLHGYSVHVPVHVSLECSGELRPRAGQSTEHYAPMDCLKEEGMFVLQVTHAASPRQKFPKPGSFVP